MTWYNCPNCGQKLFKILPDAVAVNILVYCKKCKNEIEINIRGDKMDNKKIIIENLNQIRSLLLSTLLKLDDENKDGKQFDYVNSPRLSDAFDAASVTMQRIEKIIYQK